MAIEVSRDMGNELPTEISHQRYYQVATLLPRAASFSIAGLRKVVDSAFQTSDGRLPPVDAGDRSVRVSTFCIHATDRFAGSEEARQALATKKPQVCAYDAFVLEVGAKSGSSVNGGQEVPILLIGTSYAGLTKHVCGALASRGGLLKRALFGVADLQGVVALCRRPKAGSGTRLTLTGVSTLRAGGKYVRGLKVSGSDVLAGGVLELVENWMRTAEDGDVPAKRPASSKSPLVLQSTRVRAEAADGSGSATLTMARDGSAKMWMKVNARSLVPFATALGVMRAANLFSESSELPRWAEEAEF